MIERQIEELDFADVEAGWAEALENEWERLSSQLAMSLEEIRLQKCQIVRCNAGLLDLQLEFEDDEVDVDDIGMREQEEFELLRTVEHKRADAKRTHETNGAKDISRAKLHTHAFRKCLANLSSSLVHPSSSRRERERWAFFSKVDALQARATERGDTHRPFVRI